MWGLNNQMWEKSKGTTKCHKRIVICDIGTAQYDDRIVKYEKKGSTGTTKCEEKTVTYDVGTAQCKNITVKCEKRVREPLNVRKELSHVMLELHNMRMELLNVKKK